MPQLNDLSRSLVALDQDSTIIAVVEMSQSSWLVAGVLPGIERQPQRKLEPSAERLLGLLHRWRDEAVRAGKKITRIALAFEAGRDGFWLARWLNARGVEAHVIHPSSVAVSREHRRAKTDRLDTELLKRGFLGWLRGERGHCSMARVPTIAEEDAKRPNRERECLVGERTRIVNRMKATLARLGVRNFKPTLRGPAPAKALGHAHIWCGNLTHSPNSRFPLGRVCDCLQARWALGGVLWRWRSVDLGIAASKKGAALLAAMVHAGTACVRRMAAGKRRREVQFNRLLGNPKVTVERLISGWGETTGAAVAGRHVLAIQDTSEINCRTTRGRTRGLGEIGK